MPLALVQCAWLFVCLVVLAACSRRGPSPASDPEPRLSAPHPAASGVTSMEAESPGLPPALAADIGEGQAFLQAGVGEARRITVQRLEDEPLLRAQLVVLREHFGPESKGPFFLQRVELAGGRTAFLVARTDDGDPVVLVVDRDRLAWSKRRPVAGIVPPVRHLTMAPRPDGGVVLFAWVEALRTVAARMWADDSNPFGDFELFTPAACDALSAAYGPGLGWVVACVSEEGTRAQRMREDGTIAWLPAREGVTIGAAGPAGAATLLPDGPSALLVVQRVAAIGGDRLVVFRYDERARPLWAAPVDLGVLPRAASERLVATVSRDGAVRLELPRGLVGKNVRAAEVSRSGQVHLTSR